MNKLMVTIFFSFLLISCTIKEDDLIKTIESLQPKEETQRMQFKVVDVVDGDTFKVDYEGKVTSVRLIGIDTPETVHPSKPVQCFGVEASKEAHRLLENRIVTLEFDITQGMRDKYGRLLAYAFVDGFNYNEHMIKNGFAFEYTYDSTYNYHSEFLEAEEYAQENQLGLWGNTTCGGVV